MHVKDFVEKNSSFNHEETNEIHSMKSVITFSTDANGDKGAEEHGEEDVKEAHEIGEKVMRNYSTCDEYEVETVDEFVYLTLYMEG